MCKCSQVYHGLRYRFQLVVDEIRVAEVPEYQASLLAFINCIIWGESDLVTRCSLRNEFLGRLLAIFYAFSNRLL